MFRKKLIEELYFCEAECNICRKACLLEPDRQKLEACMMLDQDCADICRVTAIVLERNSKNASRFLDLCEELCLLCAEVCAKHHHDHCQKCESVCRRCAELCSTEKLMHE